MLKTIIHISKYSIAERAREKRVRIKSQEQLKDKSLFDLVKIIGQTISQESKKYISEIKTEYNDSYRFVRLIYTTKKSSNKQEKFEKTLKDHQFMSTAHSIMSLNSTHPKTYQNGT